jgi:glucose-6-phosphate isomerase
MITFAPDPNYPTPESLMARAEELWRELPANPMAGWLKPTPLTKQPLAQWEQKPAVLVVLGVGGSYLGTKAVYEALQPTSGMELLFSGTNFSTREALATVQKLGSREFAVNVVSKSGSTRETWLALEFWQRKLTEKYGEDEAKRRILVTTERRGKLFDLATASGWEVFEHPENVGGRYSVLTTVGLVPLTLAGADTADLLAGAQKDQHATALRYAAWRAALAAGYQMEALASFEPCLRSLGEWWKQLFGESEGKNGQGLFPVTLNYSADLHSLGQYMQEGRRNILETLLEVKPAHTDLADNTLAKMARAQTAVMEATLEAHRAGGLPVAELTLDAFDASAIGELLMLMMQACAISAELQGLNPFDQPGVEAYKQAMAKRLDA